MSLHSTDTGFWVAATAPPVVKSARAKLLVAPIAFVAQATFSNQVANAFSAKTRSNMYFKTTVSLNVHHATMELLTAQLVSS